MGSSSHYPWRTENLLWISHQESVWLLRAGNAASNPCQGVGALPSLIQLGRKRNHEELIQVLGTLLVLLMTLPNVQICLFQAKSHGKIQCFHQLRSLSNMGHISPDSPPTVNAYPEGAALGTTQTITESISLYPQPHAWDPEWNPKKTYFEIDICISHPLRLRMGLT